MRELLRRTTKQIKMNEQLLNKILGEVKVICGIGISQKTLHQELADEIIITAENAVTTAYQAGQDDLKKKFKDKLFTGFKAPKGNEQFNNGWKQCRYQVLEIIKLMEKL